MIRFYAALLAPQNHDTELDWDEFRQLREEVLANQYGNLVQRTLVLTRERYAGKVPTPPDGWSPGTATAGIGERLKSAHAKITEEYEKVHLKEALDLALEEVREANRNFHEAHPWQASERRSQPRPLRDALAPEGARDLALPSATVLERRGLSHARLRGSARTGGMGRRASARACRPSPRRGPSDSSRDRRPRARPPRRRSRSPAAGEEWPPLAVCAGIIRSAAVHPGADKLYVLEVDVGATTPRTLVAGLRTSYTIEALQNRPVVLLTNLAPRTIRRMTSQGMVLAAEAGERAVLLAPPDGTPPGTYLQHRGPSDRTISYEEFSATSLTVGRVVGPSTEGHVRVEVGGTEVEAPGTWAAGEWVIVRRTSGGGGRTELLAFRPGHGPRPSEPVAVGAKVR